MKAIAMDKSDARWQAVLRRNAAFDGKFVYAVRSTGVFCRPSCPARRPTRRQVAFFDSPQAAARNGFRACLRCRPAAVPTAEPWITEACRFIEAACGAGPVSLAGLADRFKLSRFQLLRRFKSAVGMTPRQFERACRMRLVRNELRGGRPVAGAIYEAGFGSGSRLYERSSAELGMTPGEYRKGGQMTEIKYVTVKLPLGKHPCKMLVAATPRGVCAVQLGNSESELRQGLQAEFPGATIAPGGPRIMRWATDVVRHIEGEIRRLEIPLDVRATAFERRVWQELSRIPRGKTLSYQSVASNMGALGAARAVGGACAANPVALIVPCHRVVRADGKLGGYRWGLELKEALLARERQNSESAPKTA